MKLVITQPTKDRIKELHDYYKFKASTRIADKIKSGVIEKIKFLKEHPFAGQKEPLLEQLHLDHRRFVEGNYKILYRISEDTIYITDVFDARQDPDKMAG